MQQATTSTLTTKQFGTMVGRSRASDGTSFAIPQLKWVFDCGAIVYPNREPQQIFVTHTHPDHVHVLASYISNRKNSSTPTIYVPEQSAPYVDTYLKSYIAMCEALDETLQQQQQQEKIHNGDNNNNNNNKNKKKTKEKKARYNIIPCQPGTILTLPTKTPKYEIHIVKCDHRIDCIGFNIFEYRSKLKQEYIGLSGPEIGKLKKSGAVDITTNYKVPLLCFLGDTTEKVFQTHPELLLQQQQQIIVVECTYLDGPVTNADKYKHIHWERLKPIVTEHPNILFVLIHFSLKYSLRKIQETFQSFTNVHPMLAPENNNNNVNDSLPSPTKNNNGNDKNKTKHNGNKEEELLPCTCFVCNRGKE